MEKESLLDSGLGGFKKKWIQGTGIKKHHYKRVKVEASPYIVTIEIPRYIVTVELMKKR